MDAPVNSIPDEEEDQKTSLFARLWKSAIARPLFLLLVVLPTLLATVYYGLLASPVYISESRFVVRSNEKSTTSPLGSLLSAGGLSSGTEETNAILEYVRSRAALETTNADGFVRMAFGPERAGFLDRFGSLFEGQSQEHLYEYFNGKVTIETDAVTHVAKLVVRAYTAEDAQEINERLLNQSEELVNQLAERAQGDAIAVARQEVDEATARARDAAIALADFRSKEGIIDPEQEAAVRLQMVSKLQDELIATRTQLQQMQTYTPNASQIPYLRTRQRSLEREIVEETGRIAGGRGSLSQVAARYQELRLDSEMAESLLAANLASLEEALAEARRKRAYVQRVSEPSLPDYAMEPGRLRGIVATLLLSLLVWGVLSTLIAGIREHRD